MVPRFHRAHIAEQLGRFPAVAVVGPRQSGKTTLAQQIGGIYLDLEIDASAVRLDAQWDDLVSGGDLLILDEAQNAPELFPRLRAAIDTDRKRNGRFLLLGSVSPALMTAVSESLAGRMAIVRLSPFLLGEVGAERLDDLWLRGGFPDGGILNADMYPSWQESYLDLIAMRDLPSWGMPAKPQQSRRLMAMLAASHGQPFNASQLGSGLGIDYKTVQRYVDFLEGAFLVRSLAPLSGNSRKRLVKTPRVYWRDSGLLHALHRVSSMEHLFGQPWVGASFEGFVIEQTLAMIDATAKRPSPFFFRTSDGYETDLVLDWGDEVWAVEVKLTSNPTRKSLARLAKTAEMIGAARRFLICRIGDPIDGDALVVTNLPDWLDRVRER
jgi:predicted AAA+ superfamily ATPase